MLGAISHQTLSTGARPFSTMKTIFHPAVAWVWAIGALLATLIWHFPQYGLIAGMTEDMIHAATGWKAEGHAQTLLAMQRYEDAEAQALEAHAILLAALGPDHERTTRVAGVLADTLLPSGTNFRSSDTSVSFTILATTRHLQTSLLQPNAAFVSQ